MPERPPSGIVGSISRLGETALAIMENRAELFAVELQEEKHRMVGLVVLAGLVVSLSLLALTVGTFAIILLFPEDQRPAAMLVFTLFYGVAAAALARMLRIRFKTWTPFSGTLGEIRKDRACLKNLQGSGAENRNS
jgi:uncharacterized membrane protein YqjE